MTRRWVHLEQMTIPVGWPRCSPWPEYFQRSRLTAHFASLLLSTKNRHFSKPSKWVREFMPGNAEKRARMLWRCLVLRQSATTTIPRKARNPLHLFRFYILLKENLSALSEILHQEVWFDKLSRHFGKPNDFHPKAPRFLH